MMMTIDTSILEVKSTTKYIDQSLIASIHHAGQGPGAASRRLRGCSLRLSCRPPCKASNAVSKRPGPPEDEKKGVKEGKFIHLLPTEDQPLLDGRDAFFLLDALFYPGDLACYCVSWVTGRVAYGVFLRVRSSRANKRVWFD